jgi:hypothetical protein
MSYAFGKLKVVAGRAGDDSVSQPFYVLDVAGVIVCSQVAIESRPVRGVGPDVSSERVQHLTRGA